jgi:transposase
VAAVKEDSVVAKPLVPDELWELVEPLLPKHKPSPKGGRPRVPDRNCLVGVLFVLKTGTPWEELPIEMGCGSGMTCWRRLHEWHEAGAWQRLWEKILGLFGAEELVDWSHVVVDSCSVRAVFGGRGPDRIPPTAARRVPSVIC